MRVGEPPNMESVMAMPQSMTIEEQILYWLSLDLRVRALAERLLERFGETHRGWLTHPQDPPSRATLEGGSSTK